MSFLKRPIIIGGLLVVAAAAIGYLSYATGNKKAATKTEKPYQAVFLTNGQVYFGKITKVTAAHTYLTDIYYLQVQQSIQPPDPNKKEDSQQQPQLSLIKLGNEIHKPKDEMAVSNEQILFTEEIQNDGQVGQAIERHKKGEVSTP